MVGFELHVELGGHNSGRGWAAAHGDGKEREKGANSGGLTVEAVGERGKVGEASEQCHDDEAVAVADGQVEVDPAMWGSSG
jgi:hypothetical protein